MPNPFFIWLTAYFLPASLALITTYKISDQKKVIGIFHIFLIISILLSFIWMQALDIVFPWPAHLISVLAFVVMIGFAFWLNGTLGLWYSASVAIQQATILFISFLLLQFFPVTLVALLVISLFVFAHDFSSNHHIFKFFLLVVGGTLEIFLFTQGLDIFLLSTLHLGIGSYLLRKSIIYHARKK